MLVDFAFKIISIPFKIISIPFIPFKILRNHLPHPSLPPSKSQNGQGPKSPLTSTSKPTKMYVYLGKLNWKGAAVAEDETFIVVLPNGAVRTGDTAYAFFQWTRDEYGVTKANWFQTISIDNISKTDKGDDVFTLKHPKFSWKITSQQAYENIKVTMSDCAIYETSTTLKRVWGTHSHGGKAEDTVRVWTGKINWSTFAKNEMATFIAPEGFGQGRPVISLWQWTQSYAGKAKDPSLHCEYQKIQTENDDIVKFTYTSYYDLDCTFNKKTGKLFVRMKSPQESSAKDLGDFSLAATIVRHSHDFNPPESTPNKAETEFRFPQPQPSLPRILAPMPFPRSLVETLTHTAAFVDQAGYLAKFAEQEFRTLDSKLHSNEKLLEAAKQKSDALQKEAKALEGKIAVEKGVAAELKKQLREAASREKELEDLIRKLKEGLKGSEIHDIEDHNKIKKITDERDKLRIEISNANVKLVATEKQLEQEKKQRGILETENGVLKAEILALHKDNKKLSAENGTLKSQNKNLEKLRKTLQGKLQNAEDEVRSKTDAVKKAEQERDQARSEVGNMRKEYEEKLKNADDKLTAALSKIQRLENDRKVHEKKDQELAKQDEDRHREDDNKWKSHLEEDDNKWKSHLEKDKTEAAARDVLDARQKRINDLQKELEAEKEAMKALQQPEWQQLKGAVAV